MNCLQEPDNNDALSKCEKLIISYFVWSFLPQRGTKFASKEFKVAMH
jgi:hypothetical protein